MNAPDRLTYESRWDISAATPEEALIAVDGSVSEETIRRTGRWTAEQVAAALDLQPGDRVLELGCGVGRIGRELVDRCAEWHGADISSNMLKVAGRRLADHRNAHLHKLHRTELSDLADASFDKVYCVAVLIHLDKEDVYLYLRELARVLKPGGTAYFETWNLDDPVGWQRWRMEVDNWSAGDQSQRKDVSRNQFSVAQEIRLFMRHAGLTEIGLFDESAWLQVIAAREPAESAVSAMQARIAERRDTIQYSPRWNELFSQVLDVFTGQRTGADLLAELERRDDPETVLFRQYLGAQLERQAP